jgi:hypothetical protein
VAWRRLRYASAPKDESCKRHVLWCGNWVGRGGSLLLGGEAHAGVGEEVLKALGGAGGVAELARECCVRSEGRIWFYTHRSVACTDRMAARVQNALAVVKVLRAALAAQLSWCWTNESWLRWTRPRSLSSVLCSVAFSSVAHGVSHRLSVAPLTRPLCPAPPPQDDSLSPPAKRGRAVVTKPVEVVELSDDDEDEVRATVRSARGTQSTQATQPKTRAPPKSFGRLK